jgi:hypothetical protein
VWRGDEFLGEGAAHVCGDPRDTRDSFERELPEPEHSLPTARHQQEPHYGITGYRNLRLCPARVRPTVHRVLVLSPPYLHALPGSSSKTGNV